jgi:hypothetical protein
MSLSAFRHAIFNPQSPAPAGLTDPAGRPAGRRFDVYRNNVAVSLTEALRQSFPVVLALVGDSFFTAMAREHLRQHPPTSPLMMFYGDAMPDFLASFAPVAHLGYLPDIARLELALRQSYHAADGEALPAAALAALDPDRLVDARLRFAPPVRLIRSAWPIHATTIAAEDILITRPEFDPAPQLLPKGAGAFLQALIGGATLGMALDEAPETDLTAILGILLAGGAITEIMHGDAP